MFAEDLKTGEEGWRGNRREAFQRGGGLLLALFAGLGGAREAVARALLPLCKDERGNKWLDLACEAKPLDTLFLESLRSASAFAELSEVLPSHFDLSGRSIRVLYPGAGSHLGPMALFKGLIDAGEIDQAQLISTETESGEASTVFHRSFDALRKIDRGFTEDKEIGLADCPGGGRELDFSLGYKGKEIQARYLIGCSGDDFFRSEDLFASDLMVIHDVDTLLLFLQYFRAMEVADLVKRTSGVELNLPLVVMEDLTQARNTYNADYDYKRRFDLELLGSILWKGTKFYGHRREEENFPPEMGLPDIKNAALLRIDPKLSHLGLDQLHLLMETSLVANNQFIARDRYLSLLQPGVRFSEDKFLIRMIENGLQLLEGTKGLSRNVTEILALRMMQCFVKLMFDLAAELKFHHRGDDLTLEKIYVFISGIEAYIGDSQDITSECLTIVSEVSREADILTLKEGAKKERLENLDKKIDGLVGKFLEEAK